ncbi:beta-ketoacyl synthase N-terminal-like domain-containing protein [Streptomyces sp. NPDC047000]|uniref:beta-ketoacyl-[acyl-carrier-protein] synthase family protein n=1 Tax=Streptomyces sp. NPDC047000 TaxID=3155474 RepID=UPI0033CBE3A2
MAITGMSALSACGRGVEPLFEAAVTGAPAFAPVTRFDTGRYRASSGAEHPGSRSLAEELTACVDEACTAAKLTVAQRAATPLLMACHPDPAFVRMPADRQAGRSAAGDAVELAESAGLGGGVRVYTSACVAGSTAVADAAALVAAGRYERLVVAAGYLLDEDHFALFDAGRSLSKEGSLRAFAADRSGLLLGDAVACVVVESAASAAGRGAQIQAELAGWGRAGDAHHVSQPHPEGVGMTRAIVAALRRAGLAPSDIGYVNAHGTGTRASDAAEAVALHRALGPHGHEVPVSSTKTVHGHTLEAAGVLELTLVVRALQARRLPVNAGVPDADPELGLTLVGETPTPRTRHALSLNAAFGGANTALVVSA